jgi:hypothetical protein
MRGSLVLTDAESVSGRLPQSNDRFGAVPPAGPTELVITRIFHRKVSHDSRFHANRRPGTRGLRRRSGFAGVIRELQSAGIAVQAPPNPLRGVAFDASAVGAAVAAIDGPVLKGTASTARWRAG